MNKNNNTNSIVIKTCYSLIAIKKFFKYLFGDEGIKYVDNFIQNSAIEKLSNSIDLFFDELLKNMTEREINIIKLRFGFKDHIYTLKTIGEFYGISSERVRQIESKSLRKLKHPSRRRICYYLLMGIDKKEIKEELFLPDDLSFVEIKKLPFSIRTINILTRNNILTLCELINKKDEYLINIKIGKKGLLEINDFKNKFKLK